jgi:CRP/FNR family transcriptional regulator
MERMAQDPDEGDTAPRTHYTEYPTRLLYLPRGTQRLEKLGFSRAFRKDYVLVEPGEIPLYCYIVKKGRVITYEFTPSGEERVYNFMEEGSLLLEANVLTNKASPVYFKTAVPSELVCIEKGALMAAMAKDPQLTSDVVESISDKFFASMDQLRQACYHNATWNLCNLLLIFADRFGIPYDGKVLIKEKVSQQMLSNLLGINRITTVRIIKELRELNYIEKVNGFYCIRDVESLKSHQNALIGLER